MIKKRVRPHIRESIRQWLGKLRHKPPVIRTAWGPTTESMRKQAAINLRASAEKRRAVLELLTEEYGSAEAGRAEAKRRFPEVKWDADNAR